MDIERAQALLTEKGWLTSEGVGHGFPYVSEGHPGELILDGCFDADSLEALGVYLRFAACPHTTAKEEASHGADPLGDTWRPALSHGDVVYRRLVCANCGVPM